MKATVEALRAAFDRLANDGRRIGFWWRDDDAVADSPALDRLLALTRGGEQSLSLAVIPDRAEASLVERLRGEDGVTLLVHGWRHANHAKPYERKAEYGPHRPIREMADETAAGLVRLAELFGLRALPVFVPPWNRIVPGLAEHLPAAGYRALSCFGEPQGPSVVRRLDAHLDPVDWRGTKSLAEPEALVAMMHRAIGRGAQTIGLLTHHLVFDEKLWSFCEELSDVVRDHPAIEPLGLAEMLAVPLPTPRDLAEARP